MSGLDFLPDFPVFGGLLCFLLAAGELVSSRRRTKDVHRRSSLYFAGFLMCLGIIILHGYLIVSRHMLTHTWFYSVQLGPAYLAGPLFYATFRTALDGEQTPRMHAWHWLPGGAAFLPGLTIILQSTEAKIARVQHTYAGGTSLEFWLVVGAFAHFAAYAGALMLYAAPGLRAAHRDTILPRVPWIAGFAVAGIGISAISIAVLLGGAVRALSVSIHFMTFWLLVQYLTSRAYPDFFEIAGTEMRRGSYRLSRLGGLDLNELERRLERLMLEERIYLQEELSIADLSRFLGVSVHQLSEFFNKNLGVNFANYVNRYRIREAQRLLREREDLTILNIAYEVGFNSKSAFHTAFQRHCETTPSEYRRKARVKN